MVFLADAIVVRVAADGLLDAQRGLQLGHLPQVNPGQPDVVGVMKLRRGQPTALKFLHQRLVAQMRRAQTNLAHLFLL